MLWIIVRVRMNMDVIYVNALKKLMKNEKDLIVSYTHGSNMDLFKKH